MRKTDITNYKEKKAFNWEEVWFYTKGVLSFLLKSLLTVLLIFFVAGVLVCFNLLFYLVDLSKEPSGIDLDARSLNLSSFVYVQDPETGEFVEYQSLYGTENRVWIPFNEMPDAMKDAIVAIEDKRFYCHNGVDWLRTGSAVLNLAKGDDSYGGSTLTQQLIKNLTDDDEVSINRKIREILKALNVEKEYTKEEILEAYLNVVNFGGNCQGVEAASQRYFGKAIADCSIAECAAIAGITQNPSLWDPLVYPENNKERRELVLKEMCNQEKITREEYEAALEESENMVFRDYSADDEEKQDESIEIQNWYMDEIIFDLAEDLAVVYNISEKAAMDKIYSEGLKIYCAMDLEAQKIIEEEALSIDKSSDPDLEIGMTLMGLDGRVIATVGSSNKKDSNLLFSRATMATLQPGSSIKPVVAYPTAVERDIYHWSSAVPDQTLEKWVYSDGTHGPVNWYNGYYKYGLFLVDAIEKSSNGCAANALEAIGGPTMAYDIATTRLGFEHLTESGDRSAYASFSLGGMNGGVTVREMAAAYAYIGNGGKYYEPYTYYYVTDRNDNVIIDNRNNSYIQAYSTETASLMNRLLYYNVKYCANTSAWRARVSGWEIAGKTGTTNSDRDSWFCGASPYATLAVWTGFDDPQRIYNTGVSASAFSSVMSRYLEDKEYKDFDISPNVVEREYCTHTGKLASSTCKDTDTGYYSVYNLPPSCSSHSGPNIKKGEEETTAPTESTEEVTIPSFTITVEDVTVPEGDSTTVEGETFPQESN